MTVSNRNSYDVYLCEHASDFVKTKLGSSDTVSCKVIDGCV